MRSTPHGRRRARTESMPYPPNQRSGPRVSHASAGEEHSLVVRGSGGAGVYRAGASKSVSRGFRDPTGVAGRSIGAVNVAPITGDPAPTRTAKLRKFCELADVALSSPLIASTVDVRKHLNKAIAGQVTLFGVPVFPSRAFRQRHHRGRAARWKRAATTSPSLCATHPSGRSSSTASTRARRGLRSVRLIRAPATLPRV